MNFDKTPKWQFIIEIRKIINLLILFKAWFGKNIYVYWTRIARWNVKVLVTSAHEYSYKMFCCER